MDLNMEKLEKYVFDRIVYYLNKHNIIVESKYSTRYNKNLWHVYDNYSFQYIFETIKEMLLGISGYGITNPSEYSIFARKMINEHIRIDILKSSSYEELIIKMDLMGI